MASFPKRGRPSSNPFFASIVGDVLAYFLASDFVQGYHLKGKLIELCVHVIPSQVEKFHYDIDQDKKFFLIIDSLQIVHAA